MKLQSLLPTSGATVVFATGLSSIAGRLYVRWPNVTNRLKLAAAMIVSAPFIAAFGSPAFATVIDPSTFTLVATVNTTGEYDNAQLATWNGQPLSPTNQPTPQQDQLSATWNFYVDPNATNDLYIVVSNVEDPEFGDIFGPPFYLTALTHFQFQLPLKTDTYGVFSDQFAVGGETLVGPSSNSSPLTSTPGWTSSESGPTHNATYFLDASAVTDASYAFTHYSSVTGDLRILDGGVFEFSFDPTVDLLDQNFTPLTASASNGAGAYANSYIEEGTVTYARKVPEPSSILLLAAGLSFVGLLKRKEDQNL